MKKFLFVSLTFLLVLGMIAGCGQKAANHRAARRNHNSSSNHCRIQN